MIHKFLAKEIQELQKLLTKKNQTGWSEKHTTIFKRLKDICSDFPKFFNENHINEKELLAIIKGINKFEVFLST